MDYMDYAEACENLTRWAVKYDEGNIEVSDHVYDELYKKVKAFELQNPDLVLSDSPIRKVKASSNSVFNKVKHTVPMISIENSNGYDELRNNVNTKFGNHELVIEYKIDGMALDLKYDSSGNLYQAVTRGDGEVGDDITANAMVIDGIPHKVNIPNLHVRGEIVWKTKDFNEYNDYLVSICEEPLVNPRNGVAGAAKTKDPNEVERKNLSFIAYNFLNSDLQTHYENMLALENLGFEIPCTKIANKDNVIDLCNKMESGRYDIDYIIDGLVIKVNNIKDQVAMGFTSKYPKGMTALKFPPEEKETTLVSVIESYGKTGAVTPVGIVEPVVLAMTTVTRVSLHNWDTVEYLNLKPGCKVVLRKAGEIIPEIVKADSGHSKDDYELGVDLKVRIESAYKNGCIVRPKHCVHCNTELKNDVGKKGDLVAWICPNDDCTSKSYYKLVRFIEKDAMNIYGVGPQMIKWLYDNNLLTSPKDFYNWNDEQRQFIRANIGKNADVMFQSINASRNNELHKLLIGFSIKRLGRSVAQPISEYYGTIDQLLIKDVNGIRSIDGISDSVVESLQAFIDNNKDMIEFFSANQIAYKAKVKSTGKFTGMNLLMTGTSDSLSRHDFKSFVESHGGKIASSISSKLNIIVVGNDAGPKKIEKINELSSLVTSGVIKVTTPELFKQEYMN